MLKKLSLCLLTLALLALPAALGETVPAPEGYRLIWADEFEGDALDPDKWRFETHEPGWVNSELQRYVATDEVVQVAGGELIIRPVKDETDPARPAYRSGRINTWGRMSVTYGRIEARIRVPEGKGFLPAFWMMPYNEGIYGSWPRCGEIDIMEVLGDNTATNYGTLHFGNPHTQRQGTCTLSAGDFASEYHVFALEWEPGEMRWYVDSVLYYATGDWFTSPDGQTEKPYPAPFNQPFYIILNVAVGGSWPGDPDATTVFDERAAMRVDYVRVFRKDSYDENVRPPERELNMREAGADGSFVRNGDFAEEDLTDDADWKFLLLNGGAGAAEFGDQQLIISTTSAGTEEYSVQLVQPGMPMEQGGTYVFSFEARADEPRTIKPAITGPDANWTRYFPDTPVNLTPEWQTFSFTFEMTRRSDDNGRVEFNMGRQGSAATVYLRNVRLRRVK